MKANTEYDFWKKVNILEDKDLCWEWQGSFSSGGYGQFSFKNKNFISHRLAYFFSKGDPKTLKVCHSCDNRKCCNPNHLWLGTNKDNSQDSKNKKRNAFGEKNGNSKATDNIVTEIKKQLSLGKTNIDISKELGISTGIILHIKKSRNWTHVNTN